MRLDKYLTQAQLGTRSEVKKIIRSGRVFLNGEKETKADRKITLEDQVMVDGEPIEVEEHEYFMLHKPAGVVSATKDREHKTVTDLITGPHSKDIFPVGRLDKDTEGLLLLTNDGVLAHELLSPRKHVEKTYFVRVEGILSEEGKAQLENGMDIGEDTWTKPARLSEIHQKICESTGENYTELCITITEGRYHQIKRMFGRIGNPVKYLKRLSMGTLQLDSNLPLGAYRKLTQEEIYYLKSLKK